LIIFTALAAKTSTSARGTTVRFGSEVSLTAAVVADSFNDRFFTGLTAAADNDLERFLAGLTDDADADDFLTGFDRVPTFADLFIYRSFGGVVMSVMITLNIINGRVAAQTDFKDIKALKSLKSKALKALKSFLDEAFGFIDICGAKPRIFSQRQRQSQSQRPGEHMGSSLQH
jgi:hypothetical protein